MATQHFHYGAGLYGCLYSDGPHYAATRFEAIEALCESYALGRVRRRALTVDGVLELDAKRDGNEYCDITPCDADCKPEDCQ